VVSDVLRRAEAYGLGERRRDPDKPKSWRAVISLTPAAAWALGRGRAGVAGRTLFVFDAELLDVSGVSARVPVAGHEHLTELHRGIQQAFSWEDDHLYTFWLDGQSGAVTARNSSGPPRQTPTADLRACRWTIFGWRPGRGSPASSTTATNGA
jgi:hypothetical protein